MKEKLLHTLTHRLESIPLSAVVSWMDAGLKNAERAAKQAVNDLVEEELITTSVLMVSSAIEAPFAAIQDLQPGEVGTDFAKTSNILRHRWDGSRRAETFLVATRKAAKRHGGRVGRIRNTDADHDYLLARVFFGLDEKSQKRWRPAAWLEERGWNFGGWEPDALLLGRSRTAHVLIEIGGSSYSKLKLEHRARAARSWRRVLY